jgi:hypothetical protein
VSPKQRDVQIFEDPDDEEIAGEIEPLDACVAGTDIAAVDDVRLTEDVVVAEAAQPPLKLPGLSSAPGKDERDSLRRLSGFATSVDWLPELDEIAEVRAQHVDLVNRLAECLDIRAELIRKFAGEDREFDLAQREGVRTGKQVRDRRTSDSERYALLEQCEAPLWPLIVVLAEVVDSAIAALREAEPAIMSRLATELASASSQRREAAKAVAEARRSEWLVAQVVRWVMDSSDGSAFGHQPRPSRASPPKGFNGDAISLARPWWKPPPGDAA